MSQNISNNRSRKRGLTGRVSSGMVAQPDMEIQWDKNQKYRISLRKKREEIFRSFVQHFFLPGQKRDFIPFPSRTGPFVFVFESIVLTKLLLGRNERSVILQNIYRNEGLLGHQIEVARTSVRNPSDLSRRASRIKVYRSRGFPVLTRHASEINPLIAWFQDIEKQGMLQISWTEALGVCTVAIRSYITISEHETGYCGFPLLATRSTSSSSPAGVALGQDPGSEIGPERVTTEGIGTISPSDLPTERDHEEEDILDLVNAESNPNEDPKNIVVDATNVDTASNPSRGHNEDMLRYMMHYLDLVHCDDLFMVLNMLFHERTQSKFHLILGAFREKYNGNQVRAPYLVRTILRYAHGKKFLPNGSQMEQQEIYLRNMRDDISIVRELYGLKSYAEMR